MREREREGRRLRRWPPFHHERLPNLFLVSLGDYRFIENVKEFEKKAGGGRHQFT